MERVFRRLKTEWIPSMGCPTMEGAMGSLANVEVAGSNPVSRSTSQSGWWQSGHAVDCNSAHAGSIFARLSNAPFKQILATGGSTIVLSKCLDRRLESVMIHIRIIQQYPH